MSLRLRRRLAFAFLRLSELTLAIAQRLYGPPSSPSEPRGARGSLNSPREERPIMHRFLVFAALLFLALPAVAAGDFRGHLAGLPGDTITLERGDLRLEGQAPGTEELAVAPPDSTMSAAWVSGGVAINVAVSRQPGETPEGMTIRLAKLVNAAKVSFPVDPAPPSGG